MPDPDPTLDPALDRKFRELLDEISREKVPPTILELAQQLQTLLDQTTAGKATPE